MPLKKANTAKARSYDIKELSHSRTKAGRARNAKPNAHAINVAIAMRETGYQRKK